MVWKTIALVARQLVDTAVSGDWSFSGLVQFCVVVFVEVKMLSSPLAGT